MIEQLTFELARDADEKSFLECDARLQTEFAYRQSGLLRRTVARGDSGAWTVIDLWQTPEDAAACSRRWDTDALAQKWMSFIDRSTLKVSRWDTLG